MSGFRGSRARRDGQRGQGLVEFAYIVPVFMLILLAMLEFGFMFNHHLTLEYATREGARAGAAMADGTVKDAECGAGPLTGAKVDPLIMAAVQRVLESPGSLVNRANITQVKIYEMPWNGTTPTGNQNVWLYSPGNAANPVVPCQPASPPGPTPVKLAFHESFHGWDASAAARQTGATPDSIGVSITYDYSFVTPLAGVMRLLFGDTWGTIRMTDATVMALEPVS